MNTDTKSGGIVGIFRQGGKEDQRQINVNYLDPSINYKIYKAPGDVEISSISGQKVHDQGFVVILDQEYDGVLYEIRASD
jgi:alpha-galactosidase